ncbi:MAG: MBL fold metallo-hydrolase [Pseudomonadota bacterium]
MYAKTHWPVVAVLGLLCAGLCGPVSAQDAATRLVESAAAAMGGKERLQRVGNFTLTGFGQRAYMDGGGNVTGDVNAPPKWQGVIDARRTFDLGQNRALNQERRSQLFPFAAPFGINWSRTTVLQTGAELMDHPLPAILEALKPGARLGPVTSENGVSVLQFFTRDGTPVWLAVDPVSHLPAWTRRVVAHTNLGDVAVTVYFTGYVPFDGVTLPLGLLQRIDWRNQVTLMFQVDSYRLDLPQDQLPAFPAPAPRVAAPAPAPVVTPLAKGVWDVRVGNNGGPVIEFADHLVIFEAGGSAAATLARIDSANKLVAGKQVTALIVSHHHFDHTAGLRAAVSRGLEVISHRGNEGILREMSERPALVHPDDLGRNPQPFRFTPVDERLVLADRTQRLEILHVLGHTHMANGVFAYLPAARIMMEGDFGDAEWTWHWWAGALTANLKAYNIDPRLNVAVHGPAGGLSIAQTLANNQAQSEAAQKFCTEQRDKGVPVFGCPVQYDTAGPLRVAPTVN